MKRFLLIFNLLLLSLSLYSENKVSISAKSDKVVAIVEINTGEYIFFNEDFLFLNVISDHYDFVFSGYPDGEPQENGDIYYSGELKLEGDLKLKDGVKSGDYKIEVVLGYQTCDKEGYCNIPVEISQTVSVQKSGGLNFKIVIALSILVLCFIFILIIKRKNVE